MLNCRYVCILLALLELVYFLQGRPHHTKSLFSSSDTFPFNETATSKELVRRAAAKSSDRYNKTKAERILNTSSSKGPISFGQFSEQDIIFPDSFELILEPIPRIDGPPKCADGSTFCEEFDSYPYLHLRDILERNPLNKNFFFGEDAPPEVEQRIGADEDNFFCSSVDRVIYPKVGKNNKNQWKYIINQGATDGYIQGVRTETCRYQGGPCDIIGELPDGYRTSCKQKYVYRRLLSLSNSGAPIADMFELPSACCCSYRRDMEFLARFGAPVTPAKIKG